jgi:apolipoprotein N-acyltransferase
MDALPTLIARLSTWKKAAVSGLAGAASVASMAPFLLWPILFFTFPILVWALDGCCFCDTDRPRLQSVFDRVWRAALVGWAFGFGYFLFGIYWIGYAFLMDDSWFHAVSMPFAVAALPAGLALFYGLAAALAALLWRRGYARLAAFAFAFFCAEAARGYVLTGFPWNLVGEALTATPEHMQGAAYAGVYGLTLAALLIFPAPAAAISAPFARIGRRWAPLAGAVAAIAGLTLFGTERLKQIVPEVPGVRIRIVQPNIPQSERWKPENQRPIFERDLSLSKSGQSGEDISNFTHVIWPEVSVPFLFAFNDRIFSAKAQEMLAALLPSDTTLIIGAERAEGEPAPDGRYRMDRFFNSLFVIGPEARIVETYDKSHLVPFGEYMPFRHILALAGLGAFSHRLGGFEAGEQRANPIATPKAPAFLPLICYEIIFPGRIESENKRPGWIVNITNDAWFGDSTGPYQHLHQARIRAVEEGLPIMRAANTGMSAVIDPFGRLYAKLTLGASGVIDTGLPQALPQTFFEKYRLPMFIVIFLFPLQLYLAMVLFAQVE